MQDFTPDDILTFDVEAWGQEARKILFFFNKIFGWKITYYKKKKGSF